MINNIKIKKFYWSIICSLVLLLLLSGTTSATDYPQLYSGKARAVVNGTTLYSNEINWNDPTDPTASPTRPQGENKVFVGSSNSPKLPDNFKDDYLSCVGASKIDCIAWNPALGVYALVASPAFHPNMKIYHGNVLSDDVVLDSDNILVYPSKQIIGDVYGANGTTNFQGYTSFGSHLGVNNYPSNSTWKINGYQIDPGALSYWNTSDMRRNVAMNQNIERLKSLSASSGFGSQLVDMNKLINSLSDASNCSQSSYPEGRLFYLSGGFSGHVYPSARGCSKTMLITDDWTHGNPGNLTITDASSINSASGGQMLGIIATGDITINIPANTMLTMRAAVFTPGTVTIEGAGGINFTGSIVANQIDIDPSVQTAIIKYDNNLATQAPPGFNLLMPAGVSSNY